MFYNFDIDSVVETVKTIADCHRCMLCDRLDGCRWRYSCGHVACGECVTASSSCLLCLTPAGEASRGPVQDSALAKRAEHAEELLSACQDVLNIDVYKRHRMSEQQKVEKEVFPECIQAPVKYSNKRKSLNLSMKGKENRRLTVLPGEKISVKSLKMNNSSSYVQRWLDSIDKDVPAKPRRPFSDLNVNYQKTSGKKNTPIKKRADLIMDKFRESETRPLKGKWTYKDEINESGIEIDEPIIIEESQEENLNKVKESQDIAVVDKDRLAWLAVLEAEKNQYDDSDPRLECSEVIEYTTSTEKPQTQVISEQNVQHPCKIPFYKKSYLVEPYDSLSNSITEKTTDLTVGQSKSVQITIENRSFITTIQMHNVETNKQPNKKQSTLVQTDISELGNPKASLTDIPLKKSQLKENMKDTTNAKDSEDLFATEVKVYEENKANQAKVGTETKLENVCLHAKKTVVSDSDSDDGVNKSETIKVTADVHRSSNPLFDYGVFSELERTELVSRAKKRKQRGRTPNSSDSSDKENRDPNKAKKIKLAKKEPFKKKNRKKLCMVN